MADQLDTDPCQPDDGLSARERILAAAERLFAERGFDRTSTARIAAAAGVPHGLIFYHFKTKMDLLLAVIRADRWSALDEAVPPLAAGTALEPAVAALWEHLSAVLGEPSSVRKIILQEAGSHPEIRAQGPGIPGPDRLDGRGLPGPGRVPPAARGPSTRRRPACSPSPPGWRRWWASPAPPSSRPPTWPP